MSLGIALGHHGQLLAWSRPCCLKRISHDSLDADARKDAHFGGNGMGTFLMGGAALAGVLALTVLADNHPIKVPGFTIG